MTLTYRDFLLQASLAQLRQGRDGIRLVGGGYVYPNGKVSLGMVVPHVQWSDIEQWEAAYAQIREQLSWGTDAPEPCS
jgi:hypothetical protein